MCSTWRPTVLRRDEEPARDVAVRVAARDQAEHLALALRQVARLVRRPPRAPAGARGGEHRVHGTGIEAAGPASRRRAAAASASSASRCRPARSSPERVGRGEHTGGQIDGAGRRAGGGSRSRRAARGACRRWPPAAPAPARAAGCARCGRRAAGPAPTRPASADPASPRRRSARRRGRGRAAARRSAAARPPRPACPARAAAPRPDRDARGVAHEQRLFRSTTSANTEATCPSRVRRHPQLPAPARPRAPPRTDRAPRAPRSTPRRPPRTRAAIVGSSALPARRRHHAERRVRTAEAREDRRLVRELRDARAGSAISSPRRPCGEPWPSHRSNMSSSPPATAGDRSSRSATVAAISQFAFDSARRTACRRPCRRSRCRTRSAARRPRVSSRRKPSISRGSPKSVFEPAALTAISSPPNSAACSWANAVQPVCASSVVQ
jgi:hypothetical protein